MLRVRRTLALACGLMAVPGAALAQQEPSPATEALQGPPEPTADPPEPLADPPETVRLYEGAFNAFAAQHYLEAATAFSEVARRTVDPGRRAAAMELAAQSLARIGRLRPAPPVLVDPEVPRLVPHLSARRSPNRGARTYLLGGTSLLGLGFYGWAFPMALAADDDERAFVGSYLLMAGTAFIVPYLATSSRPVSWGDAFLSVSGGAHGIGHGALLYMLFGGDTNDTEGMLGTMLLASIAEGLSFYAWSTSAGLGAGEAHAISAGSNIGLGSALLIELVILGDDLDRTDEALTAGTLLLGAGVGTAAGALLPGRERLTWGDVELVHSGALLGAYVGMVPALVADLEDARMIAGMALMGTVGGTVLAHTLVQDRNVTVGQAILVDLGTLAGGATLAGLTFVATGADDEGAAKAILTLSAIGACAGFGLTFLSLDPAHERTRGGDDRTAAFVAPAFGPDGYRGLSVASVF